jgi:hypothetical protein
LVSKKVNKNCGPKMLQDDVEFAFDIEGCSENAVNTGYTDYNGPKPVKKPVKKPIKKKRSVGPWQWSRATGSEGCSTNEPWVHPMGSFCP